MGYSPWGHKRVRHNLVTKCNNDIPLYVYIQGFQLVLVVKNPPDNAGDIRNVCLIPGLGRSPGAGHGIPWPKEPGGATVYRVTKSQPLLKQLDTHTCIHTHTHTYICMYVCVCIYVCVYIYATFSLSMQLLMDI